MNGRFPFPHRANVPEPLPDLDLHLEDRHVRIIAGMSKASNLPPSVVLGMMLDAVWHKSKATMLENFLAAVVQAIGTTPIQAPAPEPPPSAPEEQDTRTPEERLAALKEVAQGESAPAAEADPAG